MRDIKIALAAFTLGFVAFPLSFWAVAELGHGTFVAGEYVVGGKQQNHGSKE
jgi:hypothetical protein